MKSLAPEFRRRRKNSLPARAFRVTELSRYRWSRDQLKTSCENRSESRSFLILTHQIRSLVDQMHGFRNNQTMIPVGKIGKITNGEDIGKFVRVDDDSENTGGYLILTANSDNFDNGFDAWVESRDALEKYFVESNWSIVWHD